MKNVKVSLCCITGNAEKYIDRFLDEFQPYVDEIVMVRAIGKQPIDKTLAIAEERGCVVGEYKNQRDDWPHVDDFAAARNKAFDMATHEWVMWADLDDTLEAGENIKRELARMPDECVALSVPYDVRDDQLRIMRERIIRKGAARWVNPVHECLDFKDGVQVAETNLFQLVHQPTGSRGANDERNVRILESIEKPTGSQRFHLVQSLRAVGRIEDAIQQGIQILQEQPDDLSVDEMFETTFTLAQLSEDPDQRGQLMFHAMALDPRRRESYGDLAMHYIATGNTEAALAMANAMKSQPMPDPMPWNLRRKYYGYAGEMVHGAALRANGRHAEADALEQNAFIRAGAKISLVHATRGRPQQAAQCRRKWLERAANPDAVEHIFGLDASDQYARLLAIHNHAWTPGNRGPVDGWNSAAIKAKGQVLVQLSDDWDPPLHWDAMILDALGDLDEEKVLAVSDGHRQDQLLCMAIMTRKRYEKQGWMFHPEFFSMYSDNLFSKRAWEDGVVVDARDRIQFEHLHPVFGKAKSDAIYERSNSGYRYKTGEGIMRRIEDGKTLSTDVPGWFDFQDVYDYIAQKVPAGGHMVEVGCWKGKSIMYLHDRIEDLDKKCAIHAVDHFQGDADTGKIDTYDECMNNLRGRSVVVIKDDSTKAAGSYDDGELDAVFIDGAHDYDSAMSDIAAWLPKVKEGGIYAGHDIDSEGVKQALDELGIEYDRIGRCWVMKEHE